VVRMVMHHGFIAGLKSNFEYAYTVILHLQLVDVTSNL